MRTDGGGRDEALNPVVGMRVRLRKPHACGSGAFTVLALGADIRLTCDRCGTKVFVERARFRNRVRVVHAGQPTDPEANPPGPPAA